MDKFNRLTLINQFEILKALICQIKLDKISSFM